jgi:hypothetical protein
MPEPVDLVTVLVTKMTTTPHRWAGNRALQMTTRLRGNGILTEFLQAERQR